MMPSSMFSQQKQDDQELLLAIAEMIEVLVRVGTKFNLPMALDIAEDFGGNYLTLQERIKTTTYDSNHTSLYNNQTVGALWPQSCPHQEQKLWDRWGRIYYYRTKSTEGRSCVVN